MTTTTSEEHKSAAQRLHATHLERDRLDERYRDAIGTTTELGAYARLRAAGDQVAALEAWLHWIDDEAYRGLNAGPFELLAESSDRVAREGEHHDYAAAR
jgi:hypothetical protein